MNKNLSYIAWTMLAIAVGAWCAVWYAGALIRNRATAIAAVAASSEQQLDKAAYAKRVASLATETKDERDRLDSFVGKDIVTIANIIEQTGKSIGVETSVSGALPQGSVQILPGDISLQSIVFVVQAQGSFAALMHLESLFELLPLPSSVQQVEIEHLKSVDTKAYPWRMTVRIRIMTTSSAS